MQKQENKTQSGVLNERENFRKLFKQTPEMVCILKGPNHVFEFVNEAHISALGFDATGMAVREAQPESVEVHGILDRVYETGVTAELHEIPITLGDHLRYFNLTYAARRDENGDIDGIMILGLEVSDIVNNRKAIGSALAVIEAQKTAFELALRQAPLKEVLELLVKMVEEQTGHEALGSVLMLDETGTKLFHLAGASLPAEYNNAVNGLLIGPLAGSCGTAAFLRAPVIVKDISIDPRWAIYKDFAAKFGLRACWSTPIFSSQGKILGTFALYHKTVYEPLENDQQIVNIAVHTSAIVIERQRETNSRVFAEDRLNLALISGNIGFWDWNAETDFTFLSETLMDEWGIDSRTYQNTLTEAMERIHPDDRARIWEEIELATFQQKPYDVDYRVIRPSGEVIWINAKGRYYLNENGTPSRLSGITINITDRRETEEELKKALHARDEFLSIASHELKTPLTSLKLQNQMTLRVIEKNDTEAFTRENIGSLATRMDKQIVRITGLIDEMLDVSKIRAGKLTLNREHFDFCELVKDVIDRLSVQFSKNSYELPELYLCKGAEGEWDRSRIEQVITNLLTNAIKYGAGNPISVRVICDKATVTLTIADRGPGIEDNLQDIIFERFERAVSASEISGLGLGLFISKQIVVAHDGQIGVRSTKGHGSTFFVELPKHK